MAGKRMQFANLDENGVSRIQELESSTGTVIIAYRPRTAFAALTDEQLRQLQQAEQELGVVLLAYKEDMGLSG